MTNKLWLALLITLFISTTSYAVEGFQEVAKEEQKAYDAQMKVVLKKQLSHASKTVQALYKSINYESIWVEQDYLTYHTEMLISELEADFKKGLYKKLRKSYNKTISMAKQYGDSQDLTEKAKAEMGIMQLYADSIASIIKNKKLHYTATSLLQPGLCNRAP